MSHRRRRRLQIAALSVGLTVLASSAAALTYDKVSSSQLFPGTRIGDVKVGSRAVDDAQALLIERVVRPQQAQQVILRADTTLRTTAGELGLSIDVANAVRSAYERQRETNLGTRLWRRIFGDDTANPMQGEIDEGRLDAFLAGAAKSVDRPVRDATVEVHDATLKVVPHQVGRRLDVRASAPHLTRALLAGNRDISLPVALTQPTLRTEQFNKVVFVHTGSNRLDLYMNGKLDRSYPVATGTPGYATPHGQFRITAKRRNPTWGNPWAPWSMDMPASIGPGPNNPLGTRAMNLSASGIRIHGTPDADSIGGPASHGCIRMHMHDAEELFEIIDVGTPVLIRG